MNFTLKNKTILVVLIIAAIGIAATWTVRQAEKLSQPPSIESINISADITTGYATIEALHKDAQIIAEVEIDSAASTKYGGVVFTLSQANIIKSYKGTNQLKNITILETGGVFDNKNYIFNHNKAAKSGDHIIVFLKKYTGPIHNDCYVILGSYQGKFTISDHGEIIPPNEVQEGLKTMKNRRDLGLN